MPHQKKLKAQVGFLSHNFSPQVFFKGMNFFFFLAAPVACGSSLARDQTLPAPTFLTRATAATTPVP